MSTAGLLAPVFIQCAVCQSSQPLLPLGPGDVVKVAVEEEADLTRSVTISGKGEIELPLLKQPLHAEGLTPAELGTLIEQAYKRERILIRPVAEVTPLEYHSYLVRVTGEVARPFEFQALEPVRLLTVLARAGGPTTKSSGDIEVIRRPHGTAEESKQIISIRSLLEDNDPAPNILVKGGEEIHLPPQKSPVPQNRQ